MSGKCLAIIWDNRQRVYGVRLEKSAAGALVLTQFAEAPESRKSFAERLRSVYDALTESGDELTVLGGAIADLVCVELRLPDLKPQELHEALNYQLRCLLPVEIGDIAYAFRRLPPDEPSRCRLRVEVVPKARLETLFEDIRQSGVRADLLTHPFMAVDPLLADREVFFLDIDPDFSLSRSGDDGLRHINVLELLGERPEEIHLPELVKRNRRKAPDRPVYAAAVILPRGCVIDGLNDSKKLTPKKRDALYDVIIAEAEAWAVASVSAAEIDATDILSARMKAMQLAIDALAVRPDFALIDGNRDHGKSAAVTALHACIIGGDGCSASIAAASILAKVSRDRYVTDVLDPMYPQYGFAKHKGYGTRDHYAMLDQYGPCPEHRMTFLKKWKAGKQ